MAAPSPYKRVLLKISGESFCKRGEMGIDPDALSHIASEIVEAAKCGVQIAVVTGGGNMIRGADLSAKLALGSSAPLAAELPDLRRHADAKLKLLIDRHVYAHQLT